MATAKRFFECVNYLYLTLITDNQERGLSIFEDIRTVDVFVLTYSYRSLACTCKNITKSWLIFFPGIVSIVETF